MQNPTRRLGRTPLIFAAALLWGCQAILGLDEGTPRIDDTGPGGQGGAGASASGAMAGAAGTLTSGGSGGVGGVSPSGGIGGAQPTGGTPGGGAGGTPGGAGGIGGAGGSLEDPYTCFATQAERDPDPGGSTAVGSDCCGGLGICSTLDDLPSDGISSHFGLVECNPHMGLVCAPKPDEPFPTPQCTLTLSGVAYEGRCLPECFIRRAPGAATFDAGDCPTDVFGAPAVCAPCYGPLDGYSTGVCSWVAGDAPVEPPPTPFEPCGRYPEADLSAPQVGRCIESALAQDLFTELTLIPQDTCDADQLCMPVSKLEDANSCFHRCDGFYGAGACVPTYVVEAPGSPAEGFSDLLGSEGCSSWETCAPCTSPFDGEPSGACDF
jgi:hypothetical protein